MPSLILLSTPGGRRGGGGSGPRGNYVHMGRHGLYYRASLGSRRQPPRTPSLQPPAAIPDIVPMSEVEVGEVLEMRPAEAADFTPDDEMVIAHLKERLLAIARAEAANPPRDDPPAADPPAAPDRDAGSRSTE